MIEPSDLAQIKELIQSQITLNDKENVYNGFQIPGHAHTGTDSYQINPNDLVNSSLYFAEKQTLITPAQILLLNTTPITLVPAPGLINTATRNVLNAMIIVEGITAKIYAGSAAYTGANALEFRYTNAAGANVTADIPAAFINTTANTMAYAHVAGVVTALTPVPSVPIIVTVPTANPATGNGKILVSVKYRIVSL